MMLETFFARFNLLSDAPNAVEKMRKLVLDLAVQGKLVLQDPNDVPAGNLLSQISEEKRRLVSKRIIRQYNEAAPICKVELPFEAPIGWEWVRLSNLTLRIQYGFTASAKPELKAVRLLRITDIQNNFVNWQSVPGCEINERDVAQFQLQRGDILVARTGGTVGKTYLVQDVPVVAIFASYLIRIQGGSSLFDRYLKLFLESSIYWFQLEEGARGAAQPNVNGQTLGRMVVPLPPLAEQYRIVEKVDELMALCDQLEAQQQERETRHTALARASLARFAEAPTPANLQLLFHKSYDIPPADLRKAILTLAVQGKLAHQDPNDEPAKALLSRIDSARTELQKAGIVPKQKVLTNIADDECHHSIPDTWKWVRLQRIAEIIDPNPSHRMPRYCVSGVPFISTENFVGREEIDFTIGKQVDEVELEDQKKRFSIRQGSFAISRIGTIGKTRVLPLERNYCMSHALVVIAPYSQDIESRFLRTVVSSDAVQDQASHGAKSIGVPDLGMGKIRSFVVPLPPLAEQRRIVAKVDQLMALVDQLESQLAASKTTAAKLMEALVAEITMAQVENAS